MRTHRFQVLCTVLVAGLVLKTGCGGDFLGLEDYQRDLLGFGLLAAVILNDQADRDAAADAGAGDAGDAGATQPIPGPDGLACWDLDGDGEGNVETEDTNGDGAVDILDCRGTDGQNGADGQDGADGADGANGQDGADGQIGADGQPGADGQVGADGQDGADGSSGSGTQGPQGIQGPAGPAFFDIFIDDFFTASDADDFPPFGDLPVNAVSIKEPAIGVHEVSGTVGPVAFRVAIPQAYDEGNDITMRLFLHRTGPILPERCHVITVDGARWVPGPDAAAYGSRRWLKVDIGPLGPPVEVPPIIPESPVTFILEGYLVVDLPINNVPPAEGLGYPTDLSISDMVAFEFDTYTPIGDFGFPTAVNDGGLFHLLGVEFFESPAGTAQLLGAALMDIEPEFPCDYEYIAD